MAHLIILTFHFLALSFLTAQRPPSVVTGPRPSIAPSPNFVVVCRVAPKSRLCARTIVRAIDNARAQEGLGPIELPANFLSDAPVQQLFVLANTERIARGLMPAVTLTATLNESAAMSAPVNQDPQLPASAVQGAAYRWSSNWAETFSPLAADYYWMYDDGWAGKDTFNVDVTDPYSKSAWDHRNNILLPTLPGQHLAMGAAVYPQSRPFETMTELFLAQS